VTDAVSDVYLERHAYWALPHLDAVSWRLYLPHLIAYALDHPDDPAMVVEGLIQSLRPPDRFPPRLGSLTEPQEEAVRVFLEAMALDPAGGVRDDARQALEEWWWPNPTARPTADEIARIRAEPTVYRDRVEADYRLAVPDTLGASGVRDIPSESRRVQTWGGSVCGDVPAVVALNVFARPPMTFDDALTRARSFFDPPPILAAVDVRGARRARRIEGLSHLNSPAEPQHLIVIVADAASVFMLTVRVGLREDAEAVAGHIAESFEVRTD
jgi:hypothetical protein